MANPLTAGQATFVSRLAANTGLNQGVLKAWVLAEESSGAAQSRQAANNHNWLNIGYFDSGPGAIAHAAAFSNPVSAADATAKFLKGQWGGASTGIQGILHTAGSNPMNQINAIAHSGWASSGYNGGSTLRSLFSQYGGGSLGAVAQARSGTNSAVSAPTFTSAGLSGGQVDRHAAGVQALLSAASRPINTSGKLSPDPILKNLVANVASGQYTTPSQANTKTAMSPSSMRSVAQATIPGGLGDVNPLHHFTLGRSDMGVDANAAPGTAIIAPNTSRVVGIIRDWFKGQPYVALKLLSGPNKGKVWYVAEQIAGVPRVGQVFQRGTAVTHYASSGTGIEIGWASPKNPLQTLAQATTGYSEGQVTSAGSQFRNYLSSLR